MLWDPGFSSWQQLDITGQPQGRLLTADGTVVAGWAGGLPEDDIMDFVNGR